MKAKDWKNQGAFRIWQCAHEDEDDISWNRYMREMKKAEVKETEGKAEAVGVDEEFLEVDEEEFVERMKRIISVMGISNVHRLMHPKQIPWAVKVPAKWIERLLEESDGARVVWSEWEAKRDFLLPQMVVEDMGKQQALGMFLLKGFMGVRDKDVEEREEGDAGKEIMGLARQLGEKGEKGDGNEQIEKLLSGGGE